MLDELNITSPNISQQLEVFAPNCELGVIANAECAALIWEAISAEMKLQLANVYQAAFAGPPWFEVGKCQGCGNFSSEKDIFCPICANAVVEAYPTDQLIEEYFPTMLAQYTPGLIVLATDESGTIVGFSIGGYTSLEDLILNKYQSEQILDSIVSQTGLSPGMNLFYDNETAISPEMQGMGFGKQLSMARIIGLNQLGFQLACGRTVNENWLGLKKVQYNNQGYRFSYFVPEGETYEANGVPRYFYLARKD